MFCSESLSWLRSDRRGQGRQMLSLALAYSTLNQTGERKQDRSEVSVVESSGRLSSSNCERQSSSSCARFDLSLIASIVDIEGARRRCRVVRTLPHSNR